MGRRAGLEGCGKILFPPGFDPRTVEPVASRYTDYAISVCYQLIACYLECTYAYLILIL